jgi:outer membrane receptor for ferrienterochelin and colicin
MFMPKKAKLALALSLALAASAPAFAQQTSAAVGGRVTEESGAPVAGAEVTILHAESGTTSRTTTDASGRYSARGLRVGGPYVITIEKDGQVDVQSNVYLQLGDVNSVDGMLASAQQLDTVEVVGVSEASVFSPDKMGTGTNVSQQQIEALPSAGRNIQDLIRLDPRVAQVSKADGAISAGGQNTRFNSIKIDGVSASDTFGLEANNLPTRRQPVSIDAIEAISIDLANYDVTISGATGAIVDAVTKSGTNEFSGSVYGAYRNDSMVGDDPEGNDFNGFDDESTYGFTLGGPIIQDTLFFFVNYEKFDQSAPGPNVANSPLGFGTVTMADLDEAARIAREVWGFDAGSLLSNADTEMEEYAAKFDWNINDNHRASFRYSNLEQSTLRIQGISNTGISLSSHWFNHDKSVESYVGQLFSDWNDIFSTELKLSYRDYAAVRTPSVLAPSIGIGMGTPTASGRASGPYINIGTETNTHYNILETETLNAFLAGTLILGDHELKFGIDFDSNDIYNLYGPQQFGVYTFNSLADFAAGNFSAYTLRQPLPGRGVDSIAAAYTHDRLGYFIQDNWYVTDNLTVTYGVRIDTPKISDRPEFNQQIFDLYGYDNSVTLDGKELVQPRFGFNYNFNTVRPTQLRGGFGLFQGAAAEVWLGNSFSATGSNFVQYEQYIDQQGTWEDLEFSPDPFNQPVPGSAANSLTSVNIMDPDLKQPSVWKANLALDHELPWWGMVASAEILLTEAETALYYNRLDVGTPTAIGPDGRMLFWRNPSSFSGARGNRPSGIGDVIVVSPTGKGHTEQFTVGLTKPLTPESEWGWSLHYTYTDAKDVSPLTSSTATSNWNNNPLFQANDEVLSRSSYEIKDRITGTATWSRNLFGDNKTTVSAFYEGRSGRPFSYVYDGDLNGDSRGFQDLFYVPTGPGDVAFSGGAAMEEAFFEWLEGEEDLHRYRGKVVPRNSGTAGFVHSFDLRIAQELPGFFDGHKSELWLDIMNIGNLINDDWGHIYDYGFFATKNVTRVTGINDAGQYIYNFDPARVTQPGVANENADAQNLGVSQWSVQVGFRYRF